MNTDFDKVYLTHKEHFLLFKMRFNQNTPQESLGESFKTFREYDLIRLNFQEAENGYSPKNMMELYTYQIPITDTVFIPGGIVFTDISRLLQLHF